MERAIAHRRRRAAALATQRAQRPTSPSEGEPVVVDGTKYRIWLIADDGIVQLRTSLGRYVTSVRLADLAYDATVGVWRPMVPAT